MEMHMGRITSALVALFTVSISAHAQQPPADLPPAKKALWQEIRAVNDSMEAAYNRGDMKAVSAFYADDARMTGGGSMTAGRAAFDAYWASAGRSGGTWKLEVHKVGGSRELAYQNGRSTLTTANGPMVVDFVVIWKRDAKGGLRILMDLM
jgi:ketosteroid isomerase-like protein